MAVVQLKTFVDGAADMTAKQTMAVCVCCKSGKLYVKQECAHVDLSMCTQHHRCEVNAMLC